MAALRDGVLIEPPRTGVRLLRVPRRGLPRWPLRLAAGVLFVGLVWQLVSTLQVLPAYALPAPHSVLHAWITNRSLIISQMMSTVIAAVGGLVAGTAAALLTAASAPLSSFCRRAAAPIFVLIGAVPLTGLVPILVVALGSGYTPRIVVVAIADYSVVGLYLLRGLRTAPAGADELLRSLGASRWQSLRMLRIHAAIPYFLAALRVAASISVIQAVVAEWMTGTNGLGYLIQSAGYSFDLPLMWAAVLTAVALTGLLLGLLGLVERVALPWTGGATVTVSGARRPMRGVGVRLREWWPALTVLAGILVVWAIAIPVLSVSPYVAPSPGSVFHALVSDRSQLLSSTGLTLLEAGLGLLAGNVAALICAVVFAYARPLRDAAYPVLLAAQAVPVVAIAPILILTVGPGMTAVVILGAFMTYPLALVSLVKGFDACPVEVDELLHSLAASRTRRLRTALIPGALSIYRTSLKVAAVSAVVAAIAAEYIGSGEGLGYLLQNAQSRYNIPLLWAAVVVIAVVGLAAYGLFAQLERLGPLVVTEHEDES